MSVNYTICKVSLTHFSECAVNVLRKVILSSLSLNTAHVNTSPAPVVVTLKSSLPLRCSKGLEFSTLE